MVCGMFADEVCGHRQRMDRLGPLYLVRSLLSGAPLPFGRRDYLRWARRKAGDAIGRDRSIPCCGRASRLGAPRGRGGVSGLAEALSGEPSARPPAAQGSGRPVGLRRLGGDELGGDRPARGTALAAVLQPGDAGARLPMPSSRAPRARPQAAPARGSARRRAREESAAAGCRGLELTPRDGSLEHGRRSCHRPPRRSCDPTGCRDCLPACPSMRAAACLRDPGCRVPGAPGFATSIRRT